jgi:acyl dehydratase
VIYLEDVQIGETITTPEFTIERGEMVEFARRWDQLPIHLDDAAANAVYGDGGVMSSRMSLINQDGITVLSHIDTTIVRRRPGDAAAQ